jgi:glycosyltransferase involved in cell wall biosynthesis
MEQELGCDFYFGNSTSAKVKKMDYGLFKNPPQELRYMRIASHFNWLAGSLRLCFRPYQSYLLTGEPYCVSSWVVMLINRLRGRQSLVWTHGWYGDETPIKKVIKRAYFSLANDILLYGNYAKNLMLQDGFDARKLHTIYNSLAFSHQKSIRQQLHLTTVFSDHFGNTQPTLVFVGRLEHKKKLYQLLEVLAQPSDIMPNICIIGDGQSRKPLEDLATELGLLDRVWFYGACYEEIVLAGLIYNAHLCVSPGEVGLTAIHALTYGTPVITHGNFVQQMPEFEAIEPNVTGKFFEENNVKDLGLTIQNWLCKYPAKTKDLVQACFSKIDEYYNTDYQLRLLKQVLA